MRAVLAAWLLAATLGAEAQPLQVCEDAAGWMPFAFVPRGAGADSRPLGFSIDVLDALDLQVEPVPVRSLPWLRCLAEIERGEQMQFALTASVKPDRLARFHFSRPYYTTRLHYFYRRAQHPGGLRLRHERDLAAYRVCGVHGYRYAGVSLDPRRIDQGAKRLADLFYRLRAGRCDVALSQIEVVRAAPRALGVALLTDDLDHAALPGIAPESYHMLVSRRWEGGAALRDRIDQQLDRIERSGELDQLRQRWGLDPTR